MKIIKKADISDWSYKHTCAACDSQLEVDGKDLKYHRYDGDMREAGYDSFTANCAVCTSSFTIPSNSVPKLLQLEAKNRSGNISSYGGGYFDR